MKGLTVIALWIGSAAFVAHELIRTGHWITGAIIFILPLCGVNVRFNDDKTGDSLVAGWCAQ